MTTQVGWVALAVLLGAVPARGATVYAVAEVGDETNLLSFDSATPGTLVANVQISGTGSNRFRAIDVRPATGELYGLAVDGGITTAFLYRIDPLTAVATAVGAGVTLPQAAGVAVPGTAFGIDFDPLADLIRVTSNSADNFRLDPDTGAVVMADTMLSRTSILGIAYNNNVAGATQTTLFAIDTFNNEVVRIGGVNGVPSPNGGAVSSIGGFGFDDQANDGFDIGSDGLALAVFTQVNVDGLYRIDLATGMATSLGAIGAGDLNILAMAIALDAVALPAAAPTLSPVALVVALLLLVVVGVRHLGRSPAR